MNVVAQVGGLNAIILTNDELYLLTALLGQSNAQSKREAVTEFATYHKKGMEGDCDEVNIFSELLNAVRNCVPSNHQSNPLWATTSAKCRQFMDKGEIVAAIKQYRADNGCGLYEAKQAIDVLMTEQLVPPTC